MLLLSAFAGDFGREADSLRSTRYARLQGDGPVYGRWRNRRGAFLASHFRDGQVQQVDVYDGKTLTETRAFAADGALLSTVDWVGEQVSLSAAPGLVVSFAEWKPVTIAGLTFRGPPLKAEDQRWTGDALVVAIQPAADPFSADFATALRAGCGCEIEARMTTWLAGRVGAHFRLQRPESTADVVAIPSEGGLLVLTAAGPDLEALAPLRAMMATAREAP